MYSCVCFLLNFSVIKFFLKIAGMNTIYVKHVARSGIYVAG